MGGVMQLEGRELQRQPLRRTAGSGHVAKRPTDISRRLGAEPRAAEHVGDERGGSGLSVRAGNPDAVSAVQRQKPDIYLGIDLEPRSPCGFPRRDVRRHSWCDHHSDRSGDPTQVVPTDLNLSTTGSKLTGPRLVDLSL